MGHPVGGLALRDPPVEAHPRAPLGPAASAPTRARWQIWRSPPDQPAYARPLLLVVAGLAALSYAWGINSATVETFYGAGVRSMAQSWHNFFFGAFDPWGTVSLDKLPGAFWVQALSARVFGFHTWSVVLPQVLEGTLTVLVLYRAVRRVGGALAGLAAAAVLAATPAVVLLDRGNMADTLLILLLVLAADATTAACVSGRLAPLLVAGVWVGLAFQAKMLEAWLVLPALFLTYVLAAPQPALARRIGAVVLSALVVLGVSVSYMLLVTAVPAHDRPYVDGSCNNSVFSQVFLYNGFDRLDGSALSQPGCSPAPPAAVVVGESTVALPTGPGRFLSGPFGRDLDWMLLPAAISLAAVLVARRRAPRTDPLRAAAALWAIWMFFVWCSFASSHFLNAYYLAALAPPIAALCGLGFGLAWRTRRRLVSRALVGATVLAGTAYALSLLPSDAGVRPWVLTTTVLLALGALGALAWASLGPRRSSSQRRAATAGVVLAAGALLAGPVWATTTAVSAGLGPFDSPYQPSSLTAQVRAGEARAATSVAGLERMASHVAPSVSILTEESSTATAFPILATGREFLPVGGYSGRVPSPTLAQFVNDVRRGRVAMVAVVPATRNPDMRWVITHCTSLRAARSGGATSRLAGPSEHLYACAPRDAGAGVSRH